MISSRARSISSALSIASFPVFVFLSWALSSKAADNSSFHAMSLAAALSALNLSIIFAWIGFRVNGGSIVTVLAVLFALLLGFRLGHYKLNIFILSFLWTAWIGFMFARSRNRLDQLYLLRTEKTEEEINVLSNDIGEINKDIRSFEDKLMRYSSLKDVAERFGAVLSMDSVTSSVIEKASAVIEKNERVLLYLVNEEKQKLVLSASCSKKHPVIKTKEGDVYDQWVMRHRKPLMIEDISKDYRFPIEGAEASGGVFRSLIAAPLVSQDKVLGVLRADSPKDKMFVQDDLRLLDIIAGLGAVAVQNAMFYAKTQELAIKDGLTGLKVRRFFMESLHREVRRAARKKEQLSILMLDIDHFKAYNDRFGHASGDVILKFIAATITDVIDDADVAGRYGGEEMVVLLWRKGRKEAAVMAEEIRRMVRERPVALKDREAVVTVSIGVSTYPEDAVTEDDLIRAADSRLYRAKAGGRDRVCSD